MQGVRIRTGRHVAERVLFLGQPSSGKTTLKQRLLAGGGAGGRPLGSVVIIDSKHSEYEWSAFRALGYVVTADWRDIERHPRVIWRVDYASLADRVGWSKEGTPGWQYTMGLRAVLRRGCTVLDFEEAMHSLPSTYPHIEARRAITQGRSAGVSVWGGAQAPVYVDTVFLAEADHLFSFAMVNEEYQRIVERKRGVDCAVLATLGQYEFAYHRLGSPEFVRFSPVEPVQMYATRPQTEMSEPPPAEPAASVDQVEDPAQPGSH